MFHIVMSLWVVFGLSTLNFKKLVNQAFSKPSWKQSKNIFPLISNICFSFIPGTFGNKWRAFSNSIVKKTWLHDGHFVSDKHTRILPEQHIIKWMWEESEQQTGNRHFICFSSPHLAIWSKWRICLAWLIKHLLCRLFLYYNGIPEFRKHLMLTLK